MDPLHNKKLAQLKNHIYDVLGNIRMFQKLFEKDDINYALPDNFSVSSLPSHYIGYTALHFVVDRSDLFLYLLNQGADFTKRNKAGETVLHKLVKQYMSRDRPLGNSLLNAVLSAHVSTNNICNPCDKDGISHFHIACMTNNSTKAVEFFLDNGISVDESVNMDSTFSPGYTPLHLAAKHMNVNVAEILLAYGADMHIADASGKTPLHVLIELRMDMFDSKMDVYKFYLSNPRENLQNMIEENEKIINMLLENMSSDNECLDNIGLSNFHVACMLQDTSVAEHLADRVTDINHCVHKDSKLWPGYTALHFAAHFSTSTVEMLMKKGANIEIQDSKGLTPLDICMERYKIEDICSIMSLNARWKDILFSDGKTTLVSFISNLTDDNCFRKFIKNSVKDINMRIPIKSPLWPGYTPLHLVVLFAKHDEILSHGLGSEDSKIKLCLSKGADLSMQDSRGRTPLHLAFRLNKMSVVSTLFLLSRQIPNVSDEDNLSHLHIACCETIYKNLAFKKCVLDNSVVNTAYKGLLPVNSIQAGWTPLHVCIVDQSWLGDDYINTVINILLKYGADPCIKDSYGLTPIHWTLKRSLNSITFDKLLNQASNDCVAEEYGLSYLHIACHVNNCAAVKRFLKNGTNVNLAIRCNRRSNDDPLYFLSEYDQCTPLHMLRRNGKEIELILLTHGADVLATHANGWTSRGYSSINFKSFISNIFNDNELINRARREFGWTKLHLACHMKHIDGFQAIVEAELPDINAQIFSNSPLWKTYTPLHIITRRLVENFVYVDELTCTMIKILLENGADVTVMDDERNTPLSMLFADYTGGIVHKLAALLMKYHRNFNVNPVNKLGVSHFHRACQLNDVDAIRGFLMHGVDVNHPIDYFSDWCPGYTPLHLVSKLEAVDLLICHGANVHIEAVNGSTPLHEAVKRIKHWDKNVILKIIKSGAEVNAPNFCGKTPFEEAISYGGITVEKLTFFIKHGFFVNSCNPITGVGYISIMLGCYLRDQNPPKAVVEMMMNEKSTNILGRATFHHLVTGYDSLYLSNAYVVLFEKLSKTGHDIDEQDNEGKTALHLAVEFRNDECVKVLLTCGADINVLDNNGQSALSYRKSDILTEHVRRLVLLNLDVNQMDMDDVRTARKYAPRPEFFEQIALSKEIKMGVRSIQLYDFLSETGAVTTYPYLNQFERTQIDEYFETLSSNDKLNEIRSFLKLQHRKAVKRSDLLFTAMSSLRSLLGFEFPDLCAENLFHYLRNSDLKNIIHANIEAEDVEMNVD